MVFFTFILLVHFTCTGKGYISYIHFPKIGGQPFDPVSGLVQVVLRPANDLKSYSLMPLTSIVNGALIVESEKKRWVLFSPREADAYKHTYS